VFDEVEERQFGQTQIEYKEWAVDRHQKYHTTAAYNEDNNVTNRSLVAGFSWSDCTSEDIRTLSCAIFSRESVSYCGFGVELDEVR
jgi:hypothetical protein